MSPEERQIREVSRVLTKSFAKVRDEARAECRFIVRVTVPEKDHPEFHVGSYGPFKDSDTAENWCVMRQRDSEALALKHGAIVKTHATYHIEELGNPYEILDPDLRHKLWTGEKA